MYDANKGCQAGGGGIAYAPTKEVVHASESTGTKVGNCVMYVLLGIIAAAVLLGLIGMAL